MARLLHRQALHPVFSGSYVSVRVAAPQVPDEFEHESTAVACRCVAPALCLEVPGRGHEPETRSDSSGYLVRLSNDARAAREFFHTVGDTRSQLEHRLAQFVVFREVALNSTEIDL